MMVSVTERINQIKQPYGGYVPVSMFTKIKFDGDVCFSEWENIRGQLTGTVVDHLTRFMTGTSKEYAFIFSLVGAAVANDYIEGALESSKNLLGGINGLDDESIENACELAGFDIWIKYSPMVAMLASALAVTFPKPDSTKIIRKLVERSVDFFTKHSPVIKTGIIFPPSSPACTAEVDWGVIDFLTEDTIWDMKCYRPSTKISKDDTLQVLMYWIMGQHSGEEIFKGITKIGLYNPRQNVAYTLDVSKIPGEVIREIEEKVICY